jgi:hypothetical protein
VLEPDYDYHEDENGFAASTKHVMIFFIIDVSDNNYSYRYS